VDDLSDQALRVLGVAFKPFAADPQAEFEALPDGGAKLSFLTSGCVFLGFVGILDPPRPGIRASIESTRDAGVRTMMITGDAVGTAVAIAKTIGLIPLGTDAVGGVARDAKDLRLAGSSTQYRSEVQIDDITATTNVFARATPEDKLVIVKSLQRQKHIVAMTGDGVNDAPSLSAADIGLAMGR
jgi:Ca2+-transporting ATPase